MLDDMWLDVDTKTFMYLLITKLPLRIEMDCNI